MTKNYDERYADACNIVDRALTAAERRDWDALRTGSYLEEAGDIPFTSPQARAVASAVLDAVGVAGKDAGPPFAGDPVLLARAEEYLARDAIEAKGHVTRNCDCCCCSDDVCQCVDASDDGCGCCACDPAGAHRSLCEGCLTEEAHDFVEFVGEVAGDVAADIAADHQPKPGQVPLAEQLQHWQDAAATAADILDKDRRFAIDASDWRWIAGRALDRCDMLAEQLDPCGHIAAKVAADPAEARPAEAVEKHRRQPLTKNQGAKARKLLASALDDQGVST